MESSSCGEKGEDKNARKKGLRTKRGGEGWGGNLSGDCTCNRLVPRGEKNYWQWGQAAMKGNSSVRAVEKKKKVNL